MSESPSKRPVPVPSVPSSVVGAEGPVASVYLNTDGSLPDAAERVATRWKNVRRTLEDGGAPAETIAAIEPLVDDAHAAGESLVAFAAGGELLYSARLPELPGRDLAVVGAVPHIVPLFAAQQRMLTHIVVVIDRVGAEIIAAIPDGPDQHREVEGNELHITRSAPGGWSQRRFQQRAENQWEANARSVADELVRMTDALDPRLVVVSGDVRAVAFLRDHLPARVTDRLAEVQGDYTSLDEALKRAEPLLANLADSDAAEAVAEFEQQAGQAGHTDDGSDAHRGVAAVLDALRAGRAASILIDASRSADQSGWFGPELTQVAATAEELRSAAVEDARSGPLGDVAIRAALGSGAHVWIVDAEQLGPSGVGVVLRY